VAWACHCGHRGPQLSAATASKEADVPARGDHGEDVGAAVSERDLVV
jgi:hypothetical protein